MAFISELFQQQDATENDLQQHSSSQPEMSMAEFREFQTYLSSKKGNVITNATLKIEMAKFMADKKRGMQNESSRTNIQQQQQQRTIGAMSKLMAVSGFRSTKKIVQQQPTVKSAAQYLVKPIPTPEKEVNLHGVPYPLDTPITTKKSKKPKGKFLTGLADEKVPKEDRFKNRKKRADFITNTFPNMDVSDASISTVASSLSTTLPPKDCVKNVDSDDEGFIDGLAFFTGTDRAEIREKIKSKSSSPTISTVRRE